MAKNKGKFIKNNYKFMDSALVNDLTYYDYLRRFKKVALSIFEWVNLPKSMDAKYLEKCLYYNGMATLLKDKDYGFINTNCCSAGDVNIYGLPTKLDCYSYSYHTIRTLYTGLDNSISETRREYLENSQCILVQNDWEREPTAGSMELFALRLYEAERTIDTNIKAQKTPTLILVDEKQRLTMINMYNQYDGNQPVIFGDKNNLADANQVIKSVKTDAPYIEDKVTAYKKEIWNEALTFLGINNIMVDKKERLITDEANSNNELINLNLQSYLAPRQEACKQFNEKFGFTGTDKEISVRVRSDLHNVIKEAQSIVQDFEETEDIENINIEGGEN